jgi:7-cyano-7-deazaguanine reductase
MELKSLGTQVAQPTEPSASILEAVPAPNAAGELFVARFTCPEFTSLCPVTGQPDFATFVIDYVPADSLVESKSLKLYLGSYRNVGHFHEACTVDVFNHFRECAAPLWLRVAAFWMPRGGIPIDVFVQTGAPFTGVHVPDPGVSPYRGR